jgi:hypothetical protein
MIRRRRNTRWATGPGWRAAHGCSSSRGPWLRASGPVRPHVAAVRRTPSSCRAAQDPLPSPDVKPHGARPRPRGRRTTHAARASRQRAHRVRAASATRAFPSRVRGPVESPPCMRHRPLRGAATPASYIAGARHAWPSRQRAPQRGRKARAGRSGAGSAVRFVDLSSPTHHSFIVSPPVASDAPRPLAACETPRLTPAPAVGAFGVSARCGQPHDALQLARRNAGETP